MPGLITGITLIFITLKLIGIIAWPWLWVLSPLWISLVILTIILIGVGFKILKG